MAVRAACVMYFLFDMGSAKEVSLISTLNPELNDIEVDDEHRPEPGGYYGSFHYVGWDEALVIKTDIPEDRAPDFFLIPELAEGLSMSDPRVFVNLGIFKKTCQ